MKMFLFAVILVSWLPFSEGECTAAQSGMFPCDEHRCIPYDYVCDGVQQCNDKTDETSAFCEVVNNLPNVGLDTTNKVNDVTTALVTDKLTPPDIDPSDTIDNVSTTTQSLTKQASMVVTDSSTDGGVNTTDTKDDVSTSESNTGVTTFPNGADLFLPSLWMNLLLSVVGCTMLT